MKTLKILLLLLILSSICNSQNYYKSQTTIDTVSFKYMPLKTGNIWVYLTMIWHPPFPTIYGRMRVIIEKDTILNSHRYYSYKSIGNVPIVNYHNNGWLRIDSASGNLMGYETGYNCGNYQNEKILDSLSSKINDTMHTCYNINRKCLDTNVITKFGLQVKTKLFQDNPLSCGCNRYALNFGLVSSTSGELNGNAYELLGCVFDGIVYGDTVLTGLETISFAVPQEYSLSQNYPNPFNPSTKIKFSLPSERSPSDNTSEGGAIDVKLIVYDILGKEVASLIPPFWGGQEGLQPGTYEVEWDAANFSSGIYFYKLETADFAETKRMVLIK
jgi:hypothetical protein